jgi:protein transport protein SEC24
MYVVSDVDEVFLPVPDDLLVDLNDSKDIIINLLDNLPSYFARTQIVDTCFVAALQAANYISRHIGGRMIFF